jgi:hypothetical protein
MKNAYAGSASILLALSIPTSSAAQPDPASFVKFDAFLKGIATADAATYLDAPERRVVSATEFERMRRHVLSLYEGVQVTHSFVYNLQYVDCVPVLQQPSARHLGLKAVPHLQPPAPPPAGVAMVPQLPPRLHLSNPTSLATAFRAKTEQSRCAGSR